MTDNIVPVRAPELTAADVKYLRRPFTPLAVKWRADAKTPDRRGQVRCVCFIDARLTRERLSEVDPCWTATYRALAAAPGDALGVKEFAPVMCALTVKGVTRYGMGQLGGDKRDGKYAKSVQSDALKRAGVEFHVGESLYAMPNWTVSADQCWVIPNGAKNAKGEVIGDLVKALNREAIADLRQQYEDIVTHAKFIERFGDPIDYGDVLDDSRSETPEEAAELDALFDAAAKPPAGGRAVERGQ